MTNNGYRNIYTEGHEIFFFFFCSQLQEWLSHLVEFYRCIKVDIVTEWTPELIQQVEKFSNNITHVVDHWINRLLGGFVT